MAELPLSKFAPFTKEESRFQAEVSNKLKDLNVKCANCIYVTDTENTINDSELYYHPFKKGDEIKSCSLLHDIDNQVGSCSLCRFFTPEEEVIESSSEDSSEEEELSIIIQKLDFSNSHVKESIDNLRNKLINE